MANPMLVAMLKKRAKRSQASVAKEASAEGEPVGHEMMESDAMEAKEANAEPMDTHHKELRRHLEAGLNGSRRAAKVHLKMAMHHHRKIMGD